MKLEDVESRPLCKGRKQLIAHLKGNRNTPRGAMAAKCYECMGGYVDGKVDCRVHACPLYPYMPFKGRS